MADTLNDESTNETTDKLIDKSNVNDDNDNDSYSLGSKILIGFLVLVLVVLMYYAYTIFKFNSEEPETFTKGSEKENDELVINFNLRESIKELEDMQRKIMTNLTESSTF